jgi:hypothetical protein
VAWIQSESLLTAADMCGRPQGSRPEAPHNVPPLVPHLTCDQTIYRNRRNRRTSEWARLLEVFPEVVDLIGSVPEALIGLKILWPQGRVGSIPTPGRPFPHRQAGSLPSTRIQVDDRLTCLGILHSERSTTTEVRSSAHTKRHGPCERMRGITGT